MSDLDRWTGRILVSREIGEERLFRVEEAFTYRSKAGQTFRVLPEFVTDGASVPRLAWSYMPPFAGIYLPAVILHDALYATHYEDRKFDDKLMDEACDSLGMRASKIWAVYQVVRAGASRAWKRHEPPLSLGAVLEVS